MAYDEKKIATLGGLKQLSVKVKTTQDLLTKCVFLGNIDDAEEVADVVSTQTVTSTNSVATMSINDSNPVIVSSPSNAETSQSSAIRNDGIVYENCKYVDGGFSYIANNLILLNLRVTTITEDNRFFITGLPVPKNVNNSLAYIPVSLFYAPSVYAGGYIQINPETNQGELVLSFSGNLPINTDIMIGAVYMCET